MTWNYFGYLLMKKSLHILKSARCADNVKNFSEAAVL